MLVSISKYKTIKPVNQSTLINSIPFFIRYTFHIEPVEGQVGKICRQIREAGMKVGLALKPGTEVEVVKEFIPLADMILIMTVEPGFGGQKFMADMMPKVKWLRDNYPQLDIEVDGGVGPDTINACANVRTHFFSRFGNPEVFFHKILVVGWC